MAASNEGGRVIGEIDLFGVFVPPLLLWLTARCRTPFEIAGAFLASGAILRGVITATSIDQANGRFPWE